ncbi:MAG: hypothetical protein IID37_01870 [Planctomycetes bacterium]|nr:hypothetical protein [Planctomycetota bacterium]
MPQLPISDEYFNRSARVVANTPRYDRLVHYRVFARRSGVLSGINRSVAFVTDQCVGPLRIHARRDGDRFDAFEAVMVIEGLFGELVNLETTYLGMLAFTGAASNMAEIVDAASGIPIIDMAARHYPWEIIEQTAYAAAVAGAAGTSTRAGHAYVHKWFGTGDGTLIRINGKEPSEFRLYGSIPHALNAVYGGTSIDSAVAYRQKLPDLPLTMLIDFEGRELDACRDAYRRFGDELYAVRLDTHGNRIHQGGTDEADPKLVEKVLANAPDRKLAQKALDQYGFGSGVTIQAAFNVRQALDSVGGRATKLVVSSGFNAKKVAAFIAAGAPIDAIGTGSWVDFLVFTSDIAKVMEDGQWVPRSKAGRQDEVALPDHLPLVVNQT